jgi:hypothetical protein
MKSITAVRVLVLLGVFLIVRAVAHSVRLDGHFTVLRLCVDLLHGLLMPESIFAFILIVAGLVSARFSRKKV